MTSGSIDEAAIRVQAHTDNVTHFATGIAVFADNKLLVVRRAADDEFLGGEWELPGGGVDAGETIAHGAARELYEETGLILDTLVGTFEGFDYTTPRKPKVRQINCKVSVKPGTITLDPAEHDEYKWVTIGEIASLNTNQVVQECLRRAFA